MNMPANEAMRRIQEVIEQKATTLDLSECELGVLPESIDSLTQIVWLSLDNNRLETLPESIGSLTNLEGLDLGNNQLHNLPESIGNLVRLQTLYLYNNQLQTLPDSLGNLTQLECLDLSGNPLTRLPPGLKVKDLMIEGCTSLRHWPSDLEAQALFLANAGLTELPSTLHTARLFWHSVPIDARIAFQPETISAREVLNEPDAELRRVLLAQMGYERFVREADAQEIDCDMDAGSIRRLLRIELPRDEPFVGLVVIDPVTARQSVLRVPPEMQTCQQAAAWMAGLEEIENYRPRRLRWFCGLCTLVNSQPPSNSK
jgi:hypothetical protein